MTRVSPFVGGPRTFDAPAVLAAAEWRGARPLRYAFRMLKAWAPTCAAALLLCACTDDQVTVGSQCPTPHSGRATLAPDAGAGPIFGTSCAPCEGDAIELDARGCPVLVTWASCGGDICLGGDRIPRPVDAGADEDAGDDDAGSEGAR